MNSNTSSGSSSTSSSIDQLDHGSHSVYEANDMRTNEARYLIEVVIETSEQGR